MANKNPPKYSSKSKNLSGPELREFRSYLSQLKKQGIISKSVDVRSARPYFVRGGKTLAEVVNKNHAVLNPPAEPKPRIGRALSFRDLDLKSKTLGGVLNELERNYEKYERLKKPGEKWAFQIDGIKSYAIYADLDLFAKELKESAGIQQVLKKRGDAAEIYSKIRLVRWNKSAKQWKPGPQKAKRKASHAGRQANHRRKKK